MIAITFLCVMKSHLFAMFVWNFTTTSAEILLFIKKMVENGITQKLESTKMEKDLGIIITSDLKSSEQCSQACSKANRMLGMINRSITYKSTTILLQLYKSLVRPHLEFCTAAWSPHYKKDRKLLERVQRRFARMIPGLREHPYESRLQKLNLWSL